MSRRRSQLASAITLSLMAALLTALTISPTQAAGNKSSAKWPASSYVVGTDKLQVRGKAPGGRRKVSLQVKTRSGWQNLKTKRSKRNGSFNLQARLDWVGSHRARVVAQGRPGFSKSKKINVSPGYAPTGSAKDWAYLGRSARTSPRFNPCSAITYRVNSDQVGPGGLAAVQYATTLISQATGIRFKYKGTTDFIPFNNPRKRPPGNADMFISWNTTAQSEVFQQASPSVAGYGGALWGFPARDASGKRAVMTSEAGLILKTESYGIFNQGVESADTNRPPAARLILHELGHAMGLGHVNASEEVMWGTNWSPDPDGLVRSRFSAGDFRGMDKVGFGAGCLRPLRNGRVAPAQMPAPLP